MRASRMVRRPPDAGGGDTQFVSHVMFRLPEKKCWAVDDSQAPVLVMVDGELLSIW